MIHVEVVEEDPEGSWSVKLEWNDKGKSRMEEYYYKKTKSHML